MSLCLNIFFFLQFFFFSRLLSISCLSAASYRLGFGRILPSRSGIQCQGGLPLLQRPRAASGLSGNGLLRTVAPLWTDPQQFDWLQRLCPLRSSDVRLQFGHVEPRLHVGQHDLPEGALLPRPGQLRPGDVPRTDIFRGSLCASARGLDMTQD